MPLEEPGRSKLSQFMPNHVFGYEDRNEFLAVVNRERVADHIWNDSGPSGPGLNDLSILILIHPLYLLKQMIVNECALTD
jgi:hypothetical protein